MEEFSSQEEFRARLAALGYEEVRVMHYEPHQAPDLHDHDFDAMGMVTDGELTLVYRDRVDVHPVGTTFDVPAGTAHAEHTGELGAVAVLGVRH